MILIKLWKWWIIIDLNLSIVAFYYTNPPPPHENNPLLFTVLVVTVALASVKHFLSYTDLTVGRSNSRCPASSGRSSATTDQDPGSTERPRRSRSRCPRASPPPCSSRTRPARSPRSASPAGSPHRRSVSCRSPRAPPPGAYRWRWSPWWCWPPLQRRRSSPPLLPSFQRWWRDAWAAPIGCWPSRWGSAPPPRAQPGLWGSGCS